MARLEMRRQYALSIFQSIEYAEEQAQLQHLHARYVLQLLHETKKVLKQMPNIIHLSTSYSKEITICGDLHGKLDDLLLIFYKNGLPSEENPYLFNGDFVDRGKNSVEILIILFAFLLVYPNHLHLNRGNHEDHIMNLRYGFTKEVMKKYRMKSVLRPPKSSTERNHDLERTDFVEYSPTIRVKRCLPGQAIAVKGMTRPSSSSHRRRYTGDLLDVGEHRWLLHDGANSGPLLDAQYLESGVHMPSVPSELTAKEWKQVADILWSDPKNQNGCTPNKSRGGGCYFGPDVTARLLKRYNLKMLIRVSVVEWSALKSLREKLYSRRSELIAAFRQYDPNDTGRISATEWASAVESVLHLDLPWRTLRSRLVQLAPGLISIEEFRQTWKLFNSHLKIDIDDESIDNLARSIDFNKDGSIDFNEFLEAFHVVNKFENK
ncbi:Serine/threonine-protein phosphatase with EF-hands 1 [Chelonia mydas]|uniref:Serine/threonine-protein phosphatase n=1 Tax=Chelonia mydas TaxID=8469 RepID=M7B0S5_CHEMY|nr:Serine/threonine-protein phosphatase with EF-hands 1 [Chelonia mydas]